MSELIDIFECKMMVKASSVIDGNYLYPLPG